jgi:hypothetical protein
MSIGSGRLRETKLKFLKDWKEWIAFRNSDNGGDFWSERYQLEA